jgi:hypothetical protein
MLILSEEVFEGGYIFSVKVTTWNCYSDGKTVFLLGFVEIAR